MAKTAAKTFATALSYSEGMVLRYISMLDDVYLPVEPSNVTTKIEWSQLPKTYLEAKRIFDSLVELGLVVKRGKNQYYPNNKGKAVIEYANAMDMWRSLPNQPVSSRRNFK